MMSSRKKKSNRATLSIPLSNFQQWPNCDTLIDLYKLVCIGVTLPVSSATCEHSFSCLYQLKNYIKNTSGDSWTSNLTLFSINSTRAKALMLLRTDVVAFAANHKRRIVLKWNLLRISSISKLCTCIIVCLSVFHWFIYIFLLQIT